MDLSEVRLSFTAVAGRTGAVFASDGPFFTKAIQGTGGLTQVLHQGLLLLRLGLLFLPLGLLLLQESLRLRQDQWFLLREVWGHLRFDLGLVLGLELVQRLLNQRLVDQHVLLLKGCLLLLETQVRRKQGLQHVGAFVAWRGWLVFNFVFLLGVVQVGLELVDRATVLGGLLLLSVVVIFGLKGSWWDLRVGGTRCNRRMCRNLLASHLVLL